MTDTTNMRMLTSVIFCTVAQVNGAHWLKYRNIPDTAAGVQRHITFARKFPGALYINFYHKKLNSQERGVFKERVYL